MKTLWPAWGIAGIFLLCLLFGSCMKLEPIGQEDIALPSGRGLFIVNEGNFMYGTASLSFYSPGGKTVENEVFARANSMKLGDVAQSMAVHNGKGYVAVNNSGVVFVIDAESFAVTGLVKGLVSPRYIHIVDDAKAYVTDLYSPYIVIFDPSTCKITGRIDTGGHKSTERMVQYDRFVFANCWSYDNKVLVIDTESDAVVGEIEVGKQPNSIALDKHGKIWVVTDGAYYGDDSGIISPELYRIDAETRAVERVFELESGTGASELCLNGGGDTVYYINRSVWRMPVTASSTPVRPFLEDEGTIYYGLAVDPSTSEVYVADAIDYQQAGIVYRYSPEGELIDNFRVGVNPGAFCFR